MAGLSSVGLEREETLLTTLGLGRNDQHSMTTRGHCDLIMLPQAY